jgi:hypothetical protein
MLNTHSAIVDVVPVKNFFSVFLLLCNSHFSLALIAVTVHDQL